MKLEVKNIDKSFGDNHVLKQLSFVVNSGRAFGLLGRNGAGKTTTIRIIMGLFNGDAGEIIVDGKKVKQGDFRFGYLPEERGLYPKQKIDQQLQYYGELSGLKPQEVTAEIDYWLERLEMSEYKTKQLDSLSKGNQQKIQFVAIMVTKPDIIILDELFSGLDPVNARILKEVLTELIESDKIVLFSSHQMGYVEEFCDDIAILHDGKTVISGELSAIKKAYPRNKIIIKSDAISLIKSVVSELGFVISVNDYHDGIIVKISDPKYKMDLLTTVNKYDIDEFKVYEPSLNDIFVEYTGDENE